MDGEALAAFAGIAAPTGAEDARLAWLERRLHGAAGRRARDGAGNLVWRFGDEPPALLVMAHVDTVFGADVELAFARDGDWLIGPGVGDNAAAVMALVWVLESVADPLPGLAVAFTVGEEGLGNLRGALAVCREVAPAAAIAVEGDGLTASSPSTSAASGRASPSTARVATRGGTAARRARCTGSSRWRRGWWRPAQTSVS